MRYQGPIYRPPSEADSLLIQATVGCPHNKCTFCMIYKQGPPFAVRPVAEIIEDIDIAAANGWAGVKTLFLPSGNTMAMDAEDLARVCEHARAALPGLERITVYGSSAFIEAKTPTELERLARAGLSRIHVGLESGADSVLKLVKKGCTAAQQIRAGQMTLAAGLELSLYVVLGLGGRALTQEHIQGTVEVINAIARPQFVRLRTLVPKINTLLLHQIKKGRFKMLGPLGVLAESRALIDGLTAQTELTSDHYTNYLNLAGRLPQDRARLLAEVDRALARPESDFREIFVGTQ